MPPIADDVLDIAATDSSTPIDGRYLLITFDPGTGPNPTPEAFPVMQSIDDVVRFIAENISAPELDRLVESFALDGTTATIPSGRFGENTIGRSVLNFETVSDADLTARLTDYALADSISGYILVGVKSPALAGSTDKWDATDVSIDTSSFSGAARNNDTVQKLAAAFNTLVASAGAVWVAPDSQQAFDAIKDRLVAGSNITITPDDAADTLTIASTASGGGQTSDADIDARIAPFARANNPSGTIADGRIPAGIARDSEVEDFAKTGNAAQVPDAKIPSAIARDSEVPDNLTDLDDTPGSLGTAGQLLAVDSAGTSTEFVDPPSGGTATDLTTEASKNAIKDAVGEMLTGNVEDGIDVNFRSTDRTIDFSVDVSRGATLPTNPKIGDTFILTTEHTVHGDRIVVADQFSGDTIQKRFDIFGAARRTSEANIVEFIRAFSAEYAGSAPDNTLNDGVFVQVKGVLASRVAFYILQVNAGPRVKYPVSATAEASFNTYYKASGNISFATLADSDDTFRMNLEYLDGNLAFPDITYPPGIYYYSATGWMPEDVLPDAAEIEVDATGFTNNLTTGADTVQKVADQVDALDTGSRVSIDNFADMAGPARALVASSNTDYRGTVIDEFFVGSGTATAFSLTGKTGTIELEAVLTLNSRSDTTQVGFGPASDRSDNVRLTGWAHVSTILGRPVYSATQDNGVRLINGRITNLAGTLLSEADIWASRDATNNLRVYMDIDGSGGSYSFGVSSHIDMDFIPSDPGAAAPSEGLNTSQVDARIAPFARAGSSADIPESQIPESIARDSEVENFATVGDSTDVPDSKIPSGITRDSEVENFAKVGNNTQVPDAKIPSAIARDSEVPDNLTDLDDTPSSLGTAGQLLAVASSGTTTEFIDAPSGGTATPPAVVENVPSAAVVITTPSTQGHATNTAPRWSAWTTLMEAAVSTKVQTVLASAYLHVEETGTAPPGGGQRMFVEGEFVRVGADGTTETVVGGALDFYIRHFDNGSAQLGGNMVVPVALAVGERVRVKVRARRQNNLNDSVGTIQATYAVATNHLYTAEMR